MPDSTPRTLSFRTVLAILFVLSVFLVALDKVHDPDAWLHLSHGKLLWEEKALPDNEAFTYPNADSPHIYTSWLFGLASYASYLALGEYGPGLLKAVLVAIAFFILLRDSLRPHGNYVLATAVLTVAVVLSQYRFVLRPDIVLMFFLALSIFCLNAYLYNGKKYIYALPLVHLLWANCHTSINLMFVPFFAFIAGGLLQRQLAKKGIGKQEVLSASQMKTVAVIFVASIAASLINPNFAGQHLYGYSVLSGNWLKSEIVELQPPSGEALITLSVIIAFVLLSFIQKRFSFIHLFLVVPFMVLPFTAIRFKFIIAITAGPIFIRNVSALIEGRNWNRFFDRKAAAVVVSAWVVLFTALALANVKPFGFKNGEFGLGIDVSSMPKGAVEYMDERNISGKVLNPFTYGSYIIWKSYPKRTVFIDSRGNIQEDLLYRLSDFKVSNLVLDDLQMTYGFETILLQQPITTLVLKQSAHSHGSQGFEHIPFSHTGWALVYWDDVSYLYLRRSGRYSPVIKDDEYGHVRFDEGFVKSISRPLDEERQENIIAELKRNITETGSSIGYAFLGIMHSSNGRHREAIEALSNVKAGARFGGIFNLEHIAYVITGDSYRSLGDIDKSVHFYKLSLGIKEDEKVLYKLGELYFKQGLEAYSRKEYRAAISKFKKSLAANPSNPVTYTNMGFIYYDMSQLDKSYEYFNRAIIQSPEYANAHYGLGLVFKEQGDLQSSKKHFKKYLKLEPSGDFSERAEREIGGI